MTQNRFESYSKSLSSHLMRNRTNDPLVSRNDITFSYFLPHRFCASDFAETSPPVYVIYIDQTVIDLNLFGIFFR